MQMTRPPASPRGGRGPLSSRGGTLAIAFVAALLAAAALMVFLQQYRENLTDTTPTRVLVARSLVPKGTPGRVIASQRLYKSVKVRKSQLEDGAITDPEALVDKVARADVYPGHQLATNDFERASRRVLTSLAGYQRAMTVPVDAAHGMIGNVEAGDRVDVVTTTGTPGSTGRVAQLVARNVLVLSIPSKATGPGLGGASGQPATLRVDDRAATHIAAAVDGGKVWLVLRPPVGARSHRSVDALSKGKALVRIKLDVTVRAER